MIDPLEQAKERLATSFGYEEVRQQDKQAMVDDLFARVADRYDLMNDLMSAGIHRLWKAAMVDHLAPRPGMRLIDVAGGTGDIAFRVQDRLKQRGGAAAEIAVADVNPSMLAVGRDRAIDANCRQGLTWICADAQCLPIEDASLDAYTIAFGMRNVPDIAKALSEARRVLKPGGRFLCLEFSAFRWERLQPLYDAYSFRIVPWIGERVAGDRDAYRYLVESIRRFPDQATYGRMIEAAGLARVRCLNQTGGIAALHSAWRI